MDDIDMGCEREQYDRELSIANARELAKKSVLMPMGSCYNCGDPVGEGERFCTGTGCNTDYEKRKLAEKRNGIC